MKALLIAALVLVPGLAQAQATVTQVTQPSVPYFLDNGGTPVMAGQVAAGALLGRPILSQRADKLLEVQTARGPLLVKPSAVTTSGTLPLPPRNCVRIGPQSADRTGHSVNGISQDCTNGH